MVRKYVAFLIAALLIFAPEAFAASTLTLGTVGSSGGAVVLSGATSGTATVQVPAAAGTATIFQLPGTNGSSTNVLTTDGTGVTSWTAAGSGDATLAGTQTFTGIKTFGEVHGGLPEVVTLTSNDYVAVAADCGKVKTLPTGTSPTVHLPNLNVGCTITFVTTAAISYQFLAASGGSVINSLAFSHTRGTAAGDTVSATIVVNSGSAAKWNISGDFTS